MSIQRLLIANRGEIAIRISRAARTLNIFCIAIFPEDDAALHAQIMDAAELLPGTGPAAYLDIEAVITVAKKCNADAIHPGYGFLSENPEFARRCAEEDIVFVGPDYNTLQVLADKSAARALAIEVGVPVLADRKSVV